MLSDNTQPVMNPEVDVDALQGTREAIRNALEHRKRQLVEELKNYPPPIPACDQHFNYLLEQRTGISQELRRLHLLFEANREQADRGALLQTLIAESAYLDDEIKQELRASIGASVAGAARAEKPRRDS